MSTKAERSQAGAILGTLGGKNRWKDISEDDRREYAREIAACRWPSFAKALAEERTREQESRNLQPPLD